MSGVFTGYAWYSVVNGVADQPLVAYGGANAAISSLSATAWGNGGGNAAMTAPSAKITATGHDATGENSLTYTLSSPTLQTQGGANSALALPTPTLAISGTILGSGAATLTMPSAQAAGAGTVTLTAQAVMTFGAAGSSYALAGFGGALMSVTLTGSPTVAATGSGGGIATAALSLPLFDLTASGTVNGLSSASLLMPMPVMMPSGMAWVTAPSATLTAIGSAVVSVSYEAYAVNLNHTPRTGVDPVDEMTHYTGYPFDKIVRYKNSYYGVNGTGLYLLDGTTDLGVDTTWAVRTAETDFKSAQQKTVEVAYFGGRMAPASTINLYAGEGAVQPYSYTTPRGTLAQNYRQPFGRGIKARYFALGFAGSGTLAIDTLTLNVTQLARKI